MGLIKDWLFGPAPEDMREIREQRDLTSGLANPAGFLTESLTSGNASPSGKRVTVETALGLSPVWSAVSIISEQVGQLPLKVYRRIEDAGDTERVEARNHRSWGLLHRKPNANTPADRFWSTVTAQLLLYGNCYIDKRRGASGTVDELFIFDPTTITVGYDRNTGEKSFIYRPTELGDNRPQVFDDSRILHIFGLSLDGVMGLSVIQMCRASLGAAIARDEFEGGFYARGANLSGVLKHPDKLSPDAASHLKQSFKALYGGSGAAHGTPVLEEGMEFVTVGSPLRDLQFVEAQNASRTDIAVMFKLPPNLLGGSSGDSLTYATLESNQTQMALHAIAPWTNTIASAISNDSSLLPQVTHEAEFVLEAMMRGDAATRSEFYRTMTEIGAMTADEVRAKENMPRLTPTQKAELEPPAPPQRQLPAGDPDPELQSAQAQARPIRAVS